MRKATIFLELSTYPSFEAAPNLHLKQEYSHHIWLIIPGSPLQRNRGFTEKKEKRKEKTKKKKQTPY